jgi:ABC-2 type transport system permease protein
MGAALKGFTFYLNIYRAFVRNSIAASMEYRANFVMGFIVECAYLIIKSLYIVVTYQTGLSVNGLSPDSILLFIGTYTLITGIMSMVYFPNFIKISQYVKDGTLDILMTKPVSLQFMVSFRYIDFGWAFPNIIGGLVMIVIAFIRLNLALSVTGIIGFIIFNISSLILTYSILLLPELIAFWVLKVDSLHQLVYSFWDFNNMPMQIYGTTLRRIGIYVIPIFVITNFPPLFILGQLSAFQMVWGLVIPLVALLLTRGVWNIALKRYESASS